MKPSFRKLLTPSTVAAVCALIATFVCGYSFGVSRNSAALAECQQQKTLLSRRIVTEVSNNIAMEDRLNRCLENSQ